MISQPASAMGACVSILADFDASPQAPAEPAPASYVRCSRVGGRMMNPVTDNARILVECWAASNAGAEQLANDCRFALLNASGKSFGGVFVRWCREASGPVDFPDETGPRYQFIVELLAATKR